MALPKKVTARFYATPSGQEPVRAWLKDLPDEERRVIGQDIAVVEFGWPIGMPTCRPMGGGLYEIRSDLPGGKMARVLFGFVGNEIVLAHAFMKTTRRTAKIDLDLARNRLKERP